MDLVGELERWLGDRRGTLEAEGFTLLTGATPDDNGPKGAAWITFAKRGVEGEVIAWSSGEVDIAFGREPGKTAHEHHDIADGAELAVLLDRLVEQLDEAP